GPHGRAEDAPMRHGRAGLARQDAPVVQGAEARHRAGDSPQARSERTLTMPTIRYRTRQRGGIVGPELDAWQEFALHHPQRGGDLSLEGQFGPEWESIVPGLWRLHGERLTAEWVEKLPGSRPGLWWAVSAGESRRIVNHLPDRSAEALLIEQHMF